MTTVPARVAAPSPTAENATFAAKTAGTVRRLGIHKSRQAGFRRNAKERMSDARSENAAVKPDSILWACECHEPLSQAASIPRQSRCALALFGKTRRPCERCSAGECLVSIAGANRRGRSSRFGVAARCGGARGCGALRWRDAAERELRKLGHRVHRRTRRGKAGATGIEALTSRELQVARLVLDRKTNPQIAAELFLSQKAVDDAFYRLELERRRGFRLFEMKSGKVSGKVGKPLPASTSQYGFVLAQPSQRSGTGVEPA